MRDFSSKPAIEMNEGSPGESDAPRPPEAEDLGGWNGPAGFKRLIDLALPLLVSMGAYSFMMFCDRIFLSWRSAEEIAAVVPASATILTMMCVFFGTTVYTSTFVAQYHGAGHEERIGICLWTGLTVALVGQFFVGASALFAEPLFALFGHAPRVQELEVEYYTIAAAGVGAQMASSVFSAIYSGRGITRPVMWVNCTSAGVNIPLNYALIFGKWGAPELGMTGAALSTIVSQWLSFFLWAFLVFRPENERRFGVWSARGIHIDMLRRLIRFGLPNGLHFFLDAFAWTAFSLLVGNLGVVQLAGSNIAWQVNTLALLPIIGIGLAAGIMVGQFQGARKSNHAAQAVRSALVLVLGYMTLLASVLLLFPDAIIWPFTLGETPNFAGVRDLAASLLRFVALLGFMQGVQITFGFALKGAGDVRFILMVLAGTATFGFVLPIWWMVQRDFPVTYLWGWFVLQAGVVAFILWRRFVGGAWRDIRMIEVDPVVRSGAAGRR